MWIFSFLKILIALLVVYLSIVLLFFVFQRKLIYYPVKEIDGTPESVGLKYEEVFLETADKTSICGWYIPINNPIGTVLILHGNGGNISHRLHILQVINSMHLNAFIIDYRGYGKSGGKPSEKGLQQDAIAAWNFLVNTKNEKPEKIILLGRSLGGAVAAFLATQVKPAGVIIEGTFTSLPDMASLLYPYLPARLLCLEKYNVVDYVKNISCPLFIAHSRNDEIIPFQMGLQLFQQANEPKSFFELAGSHNDGESLTPPPYYNALYTFIRDCLERKR